jgi:hypothetical protein
MAIMFIFLKVYLIVRMDILKVSWNEFMEGMWIVALEPTVSIIIGANIPTSCMNIIEERVVFGLFGGNFIRRDAI